MECAEDVRIVLWMYGLCCGLCCGCTDCAVDVRIVL